MPQKGHSVFWSRLQVPRRDVSFSYRDENYGCELALPCLFLPSLVLYGPPPPNAVNQSEKKMIERRRRRQSEDGDKLSRKSDVVLQWVTSPASDGLPLSRSPDQRSWQPHLPTPKTNDACPVNDGDFDGDDEDVGDGDSPHNSEPTQYATSNNAHAVGILRNVELLAPQARQPFCHCTSDVFPPACLYIAMKWTR